jgi:hypothetical protein
MRRITCVLVLVIAAIAATATAAIAAPAGGVVGSYTISDLGQGGWAGGPLYADGTLGGGGAVAFSTSAGTEVWRVTGGTWTPTGNTITVCVAGQPIHDPAGAFDLPFCVPIIPDAGPVVVDGTLIRVTLK